MAYRQEGFLNELLTNFRKRKDFKTDVKETAGAYNPKSKTVNIKQGEGIIEMPIRKYTKKALKNKPNPVVSSTSHDQRTGNITYSMEFSKDQALDLPKQSTTKQPKQKKTNSIKKYKVPKGKKKKGLYLKKGKFIN